MIEIDDTTGLPLHPIDVVHRNGATAPEIDDQNGEPDGRLARRNGQHEHREDLSDHVVQEHAERDEIDVHGEQDELDRHEDDDDVLPVEEDAEHAQHEQDRADHDIMFDPDHSRTPFPVSGFAL